MPKPAAATSSAARKTSRPLLLLLVVASVHALNAPKAITGPWPQSFPAKELCSNCGLCSTEVGIASVTDSCAFIGDGMARAEALEARVHGRARAMEHAPSARR